MPGSGSDAVVGVFHDRGQLEKALQALQSDGFDRSQLSLLESGSTAERAIRGESLETGDAVRREPVDRGDMGNLEGMAAGIPTYLGAVLAAGVTVASGGTLAGVAIAALLGGVGGGAVGVTAARLLSDAIEEPFEEELARGGVLLMVWLREPGQAAEARRLLEQWGATVVRDYVTSADTPTGVLSPTEERAQARAGATSASSGR
ncbi:MAG TPA: hypothetical protein PKA13_25455 [Geminicoccaceae bacterium]|nr:hypothetical protein [Geminicoccus sp.]HMU53144.1 hypothetical protein [Geminicoccaceae bacterium]